MGTYKIAEVAERSGFTPAALGYYEDTARGAAEAGAHEVLLTRAVHDQAAGLDDVELVPVGARQLKGIPDTVELFAARPLTTDRRAERTDPVCHMELTPTEVAARLTIGTVEHVFCSTDCLQLFAAAPDQYGP